MRRFAITAALAIALGLGAAGTADAHGMRSFSPGQSFNMGTIRTFPSFNSSPSFQSPAQTSAMRQVADRFGTNGFGMPNGFNNFNNFNNGFAPPTLFPRATPNFNGFGMR